MSGTPSKYKNLSAEMAAITVGDLSSDGHSFRQRASEADTNGGLAAHTLVKAFESLIVPIIRSHVPVSDSTVENANCSTNLEREAEQLLSALNSFVSALVRSQLTVADRTEGQENNGPATREENTIPKTVQFPENRMVVISQDHAPNSEQSLLKLVLEEARQHVFNTMPIRLLAFKRDGSGIELVERSAIWHRILTAMETDLNENNITYVIQQWAAANSTDSMTEEQKRKTGIKALIYGMAYTRYAILSHTWFDDTPGEVTYADWQSGKVDTNSPGYRKLANFCRVAATKYGVQFGWMDTICINKDSSSELDESIRSMYRWYENSYMCITYLADTTALRQMRYDSWFTRGWTLQELLAPHYMKFCGADWQGIVSGLGNDKTNPLILEEIQAATTITREELEGDRWTIPISRRMQWAANRRVTREEDIAYSLMGIFYVGISTAYGEGSERAFVRLVKEILMTNLPENILDILNWGWGDEFITHRALEFTTTLIPSSPKQYLWRADRKIHWYIPTNPITLTHLGLHVPVLLMLGASVDPFVPDEFRPIGNYYACAKDVAFSSQSGVLLYDFHLLEKNPTSQNITHRQMINYFGVLNLLETANTIELPAEGGCFAVPLLINPAPTSVGILPEEFKAVPMLTARPTVFDLKQIGTNSFIIPKTELRRHGMTLRTLYL